MYVSMSIFARKNTSIEFHRYMCFDSFIFSCTSSSSFSSFCFFGQRLMIFQHFWSTKNAFQTFILFIYFLREYFRFTGFLWQFKIEFRINIAFVCLLWSSDRSCVRCWPEDHILSVKHLILFLNSVLSGITNTNTQHPAHTHTHTHNGNLQIKKFNFQLKINRINRNRNRNDNKQNAKCVICWMGSNTNENNEEGKKKRPVTNLIWPETTLKIIMRRLWMWEGFFLLRMHLAVQCIYTNGSCTRIRYTVHGTSTLCKVMRLNDFLIVVVIDYLLSSRIIMQISFIFSIFFSGFSSFFANSFATLGLGVLQNNVRRWSFTKYSHFKIEMILKRICEVCFLRFSFFVSCHNS